MFDHRRKHRGVDHVLGNPGPGRRPHRRNRCFRLGDAATQKLDLFRPLPVPRNVEQSCAVGQHRVRESLAKLFVEGVRDDAVRKARHTCKPGEPDARAAQPDLLQARDDAVPESAAARPDVWDPILLCAPFVRCDIRDNDRRDRALELARMVLRDNARELYGLK